MKTEERLLYLEKNDPLFVKRRKRLLLILNIRRLLSSVQFSIILPSAWPYIREFSSSFGLYALLMSSSKVPGIIFSLAIGYIYDRTKNIKAILIVLNCCDIIGSLIYALPYSVWLPICGRILAGVGQSASSISYSEVTWITTRKMRISVFAKLGICEIAGIFFAPSMTAAFTYVKFSILKWQIDYRNIPGLVTFFMWIIMQVLTILLAHNLARDYIGIEYPKVSANESIILDEGEDLLKENVDTLLKDVDGDRKLTAEDTTGIFPSPINYCMEICSLELLSLFLTNFLGLTFVYLWETATPLFTQEDFGWPSEYTSIVFAVITLETICVYAFINCVKGCCTEFDYILIAMAVTITALIGLLLMQYTRTNKPLAITFFCISTAIGCISFAFNNVGAKSLMSKIVPKQMQGVAQSILGNISMAAGILGTFSGALIYVYMNQFAGVLLASTAISMLLFITSMAKLKNRQYLYSEG